ncbi:hypothetical protein [Hydrogenivirga sp. 128-5-R1-1]|uniref:hypothetical protein n=1 Tax=Hydrogenivirga sp. 128-5-R1-1 TaxID=392423 RepID=UPI00015F32DA|nr:hypothetical protein [Hydrogenivirga sp. 128-5-R1-1]EDP74851.1 hypothetical protein HG1285_13322 [Hydrogenivirga sp. 128-5-R1-1]
MVRKLRAIRLWIIAVWYVVLLRLRSKLSGIDFRKYLLSLVFPPVVLGLAEPVEFVQDIVRRCLRFSPFPDKSPSVNTMTSEGLRFAMLVLVRRGIEPTLKNLRKHLGLNIHFGGAQVGLKTQYQRYIYREIYIAS